MFSKRSRTATAHPALAFLLTLVLGAALSACGSSDSTAEAPVPSGPPKGILDAAALDRAVMTPAGPLFDQDETACLAANLDASLSEDQLRLLAQGRVTADDSTPPFQGDIQAISDAGAGCVPDDHLRAAMVEAWVLGAPGTPREKAECYVDKYFTPGVGKVFSWTMAGVTSVETKEAIVHTDCG